MRIPLVALLLASALAAPTWCADAGTTPPPPLPGGSATAPAGDQKPFLGVQVDPNTIFDGGVPISVVVAGGTAAVMGLLAGDVITAINKQPTIKADDIKKAVEAVKVGDTISVDLLRKNEKMTLGGTVQAKPAPPEPPAVTLRKLEQQAAELKARKEREPSLAEMLDDIVTKLDDLEKNLPKASEAFKKQYPNGEFSITISITIASDKTAKNAVQLGNQGEKKDLPNKDAEVPKNPPPDKDATAPKDQQSKPQTPPKP